MDGPPAGEPDASPMSADDGPPAADAGPLDVAADGPVDGGRGDAASPLDAAPAADLAPDQAATPDAAPPITVIMQFTGKVVTVAGTPLGFDSSVREAAVSGTFGYHLGAIDETPIDPKRGTYRYGQGSVFTFKVMNRSVEGSGRAVIDVENFDPDTFRFRDGKMLDPLDRFMKVDGVVVPELRLTIAITDETGAMLTSDALPNPFPTLAFPKTSHTFALKDGPNGENALLIQLDSLTKP